MYRELAISSQRYHDEYRRRHIKLPEPMERTRHDLRGAIGRSLIHLGERLAKVDRPSQLHEAA